MKCPEMIAHVPLAMSEDNPAVGDCLGEECARWDKAGRNCSDLSILEELRLLVGACGMIADKMPSRGE
uniref:Uncharacterized protein n=1 Tax=viral metagenome TaxID=1070528 RepID=A0A6H1ZSL1_9ZZZZ